MSDDVQRRAQIRMVRYDGQLEEHWYTGDVHYDRNNGMADVYIDNVPEIMCRVYLDDPAGWTMHLGGLSYEVTAALRYPCTDGTMVITVKMPESHSHGGTARVSNCPSAAADRTPEPYIPTRVSVDGYGGGAVWTPPPDEFTI